jgi:hypothetical protein
VDELEAWSRDRQLTTNEQIWKKKNRMTDCPTIEALKGLTTDGRIQKKKNSEPTVRRSGRIRKKEKWRTVCPMIKDVVDNRRPMVKYGKGKTGQPTVQRSKTSKGSTTDNRWLNSEKEKR